MKCIDFDKAFSMYAMKYFREHAKEYKNYDAMEAAMPDVYARFLDTPADFLANQKPGEYFQSWDDAKVLVDWMEDYIKQRVPTPDMLLNRITAVSLLNELQSQLPMELYIQWQLKREAEDELCDAAAESLTQMGEDAVPAMLAALDEANDAGREALCAVLSHYPDTTGRVLGELLRLIRLPDANVAVLAGYLGRLGDERALETLIDLALQEDISYLTYIELRSAIEELGGDAPERTFDEDDPKYEAMSRLQMDFGKKGSDAEEDADSPTAPEIPDAPINGDYLQ